MNDNSSPRTVLIVEDEWLLRELIAQAFRDAGWDALEASTAEGALVLLHEGRRLDAVVTDIQLAGYLNGWDVGEAFRAARADMLVVYTSGNPIDRSRRVPSSLFFTKPYQPSAIVEACQRLE
jgi:DNA-binding response OmpR family regulator